MDTMQKIVPKLSSLPGAPGPIHLLLILRVKMYMGLEVNFWDIFTFLVSPRAVTKYSTNMGGSLPIL